MNKLLRVPILFASLTLAAALAAPTAAQDVRELSTPTQFGWYYNATATKINDAITAGSRPIDIEIEGTNPMRFTAVMVRNSGVYQSGFWWYYGLTGNQLASELQNNQGRLIDLEVYEDGGATRFACIMVPNTGSNQKAWWYAYGCTGSQIASYLSANNARPVDIDSYTINGSTHYDVVMIQNTGADYRPYSWYYNVPASTIQSGINSGYRVYDLERRPNGNFNVILISAQQQPAWTWWYNLRADDLHDTLSNWGHRLVDLETYFVNGQRRFAMVTVNNSNALTTSVGNIMRGQTDGDVGCLLQEINGSMLAVLNGSHVFEPASAMKTLHHVHAFRQILVGAATLHQNVTVYTDYNGSCPLDSNPVTEPLTDVLRAMMEQSDNARTQAVTALFGQGAINATAQALGMTGTELKHRLGCGAEAVANPNEITLRDLARLHTEVCNGYLGTRRQQFYEHMANGLGWSQLSTVIDQEAAALGVSPAAVTSFKALVSLAQKGGSYTLGSVEHRTRFGYVRIPFLVGNQLQPREYAVGSFVNGASDGSNANSACMQAVRELMRPVIHEALGSWDLTAVSVSVGTGCHGRFPLTQTVIGMPRLGQSPFYKVQNANVGCPAAMTFGFRDDFWGRTQLPASLDFVGAPGCYAYNDALLTHVRIASSAGTAQVMFTIPNHHSVLGMEFFTQWYAFGTSLRSSNGTRNVVGD